jgi:protein-S-isoprenylcysteine O-methyltransferase Ste14
MPDQLMPQSLDHSGAAPMQSGRNPIRLLLHVPVPWVFVLGYLIGVAAERLWPSHILKQLPYVGMAGGVVLGIGCAVAGWGLITFWRAHTTTIPGETSSQMVTWGPYRFTRNPMYVGLSIAYIGESLLLRQFWPILFLPLVLAYVNWIVIPLEESRLHDAFNNKYDQYRTRVRRWI